MDLLLPLIGRVLIGSYFTFFGLWNAYHCRPLLTSFINKNIPLPFLLLPLGIFWQISAGAMIIAGSYISGAAASLVILTLASTFIFNDFWRQKGEARYFHMKLFFTKLTIVLGTLIFLCKI